MCVCVCVYLQPFFKRIFFFFTNKHLIQTHTHKHLILQTNILIWTQRTFDLIYKQTFWFKNTNIVIRKSAPEHKIGKARYDRESVLNVNEERVVLALGKCSWKGIGVWITSLPLRCCWKFKAATECIYQKLDSIARQLNKLHSVATWKQPLKQSIEAKRSRVVWRQL